MLKLILLGAAVLLSPLPALADNTADEADVAFSLGNEAFKRREYESALGSYFLSHRLAPNRNVLFNIARCYEALERLDEAYRYYNDMRQSPELPEPDARAIDAALERLAPRVALVTIETDPPGAEVFVDRRELGSRGRTPQTLALKPGQHTLTLSLGSHEEAQVEVSLERGRHERLRVRLEPILGQVYVSGSPEGATLRDLDTGDELGRVPSTLRLPLGKHQFWVEATGHLSGQIVAEVEAGRTNSALVQLLVSPLPSGKVVVTANRPNAIVRVDGKNAGFAPVVLTLEVGPHRIEVDSEEVTPLVQDIEVEVDSEQKIHAELYYAPPKVNAASKNQLNVDQAPASVTVITREEIRAFGYQTLPEALRAVRGLFFTDDRLYTYVGVRGFSPPGDLNTRVLILWDGHPMNDAWAGQGFSAREIDVDLAEVDHIEVVRGPASMLYGTGAVFGVINVVPRNRLDPGRKLEGAIATGGEGGVKVRAAASLGGEERSLHLSAAGFQSSGAPLTEIPGVGSVRDMDGERSLSAALRARWQGLTLTAKVNERRKEAPTAPLLAEFGRAGSEYLDTRNFAELRWEKALEKVQLNAKASYDHYWFDGTLARSEGTLHEQGGAHWVGFEASAGFALPKNNRLSLSVEGQGQLVNQKPAKETNSETLERVFVSATLVDEWQLHPRLFVQAGLRADKYFDLEGVALSPRGALVAKPYAGGLTKLMAGRAFRAPTVYELFVNRNAAQSAKAPGPELITSFELEHAHDLSPELRLTFGVFHNLFDGLITLADQDGGGADCAVQQCYAYVNSAKKLNATGAEAQVRWQPGRFTLVDATYSFVHLGGEGEADAGASPVHLASLKAMAPLRDSHLRLSGSLTWQSARDKATGLGAALLADAGLSGEFGKLRWFAGVRNLLDERYALPVMSEVRGGEVPQYGRSFWMELGGGF